ncbi:hypothetical protein NDU88_002756 [Pleurodeles waltl]|uniref:Integrase p58-like C-terminal domain-containing protein n=1 Tax=Pleurodeles waltl TaxID=8319 RepID=A0AAV7W091_PLEWA|nr:hypothetical protein NDU88_002756 [Pleurodeles waltl]
MLVEQWEEVDEEGKDVLTYEKELKETLHDVWEAAYTFLKDAQEKQNRNFDKTSGYRTLDIGQKVLVLLSTTENKLLAHWQGPFTVLEQVTPVSYKVEIPNRKEQTYHINLLKPWYTEEDSHHNLYVSTGSAEDLPL